MALSHYSFTAIIDSDSSGQNIVAGQAVSVNLTTGGYATIYSDSAGASPIAQPGAVTDSDGVFEFYVASGTYEVTSGGRTEVICVTNNSDKLIPVTVAEMIARGGVSSGDRFIVSDRANAIFEAKTGLTANTWNIIQSTADVTIQFELVSESVMDSAAYGMVDSVDAKDALSMAVNDTNVSTLIISQAYPVSGRVTISRDNLTIIILNTMKRVVANPILIADRAIFMADGRDNLKIFGDFDLQGEGTRRIGESGFEVNSYTTTSGRVGISGPANAALYFLRCTNSFVRGSAKNSGESGYIFRNCGALDVDVSVENVCGSGVEISTPATDESVNPMPLRENWKVRCNGKYVNDLKLGAGNAIAVSVAGSASNEVFRDVDIEVTGYRNAREIHHEFNSGARIHGFKHRVFSRDCLQGAVVTQGKYGSVEGTVINGGTAGAGAVNTGYPSLYGYLGSTGSDTIDVNLQVESTNDDGFTLGTDGAITAGSPVFTSASASFPANIVGKHIVIEGANPSGSPLEAYVVTRDSATQLTLDLNAQVTVSGATYGYGSGLRNPLSHSGDGSVNFDGSTVKGGVFSGLPSEPNAAAVKLSSGGSTTASRASNMVIEAPSLIAGATAPQGLEIGASFGAPVIEKGNNISGFDEDYVGFAGNSTATRCPIARKIVQDAFPDAAADTYGTDLTFSSKTQAFDYFFTMSIEFDFDGAASGTLSAQLEAVFVDGGSNTVTITATADSVTELTTGQLATLHQDNQKIVELKFRAKNSLASRTTDKCRLNFLAVES